MNRWHRLLVFTLLVSCTAPLPSLEGVDSDSWKDDKNGCLGKRKSMQPALEKELVKIKSLSEMDVVALLGKPDQNELYRRNQKFFYYFIEPGTPCTGATEHPARLSVRFNAMGYAQLVVIDQL